MSSRRGGSEAAVAVTARGFFRIELRISVIYAEAG
jgi:hypothetical protein